MAQVFVSYSRRDRDQVEIVVQRLKDAGLEVWWDDRLQAGQLFNDRIARELAAAECVLVVWSQPAKRSSWVVAEALEGFNRRRLAQIRVEEVEPPFPFTALHYTDWPGEDVGASAEALGRALRSLMTASVEAPVAHAQASGPDRRRMEALAQELTGVSPQSFFAANGLLAAGAGLLFWSGSLGADAEQLQQMLFGGAGLSFGAGLLLIVQTAAEFWRSGGAA
ncbi:MAG: toll/interleukin-1 receptor domain-containing protein [Rhodobacteraceae bacterium]|nr:toll/interleukin-1 receptor domain-containing protein [Paracoccaceae bacterium]